MSLLDVLTLKNAKINSKYFLMVIIIYPFFDKTIRFVPNIFIY